jgi:hypothetical protein
LLDESRRPFDVREQEGDRAGRKLSHAPQPDTVLTRHASATARPLALARTGSGGLTEELALARIAGADAVREDLACGS